MSTIQKPTILPGYMELLPNEQLAFNSMLRSIQDSYELFGFSPIDTPVLEKADVILAKAGKEATNQTYTFVKGDVEHALRFDLTVPLARYVSQHFHDLTFPFKRYQIGKVHRGEKPQKGRFREFYQCDIDIIGKGALDLRNDAEILATIYFTFSKLNIGKFVIRINNRKILSGFIDGLGLNDKTTEILRVIDKLEKIGPTEFSQELEKIGLTKMQIDTLVDLLTINLNAEETLKLLQTIKTENTIYRTGLDELTEVIKFVKFLQIPEENWKIDLSIARGLDYYTGTVYETILADHPQLGSICSGGRYDNLTAFYSDEKLPGVGISIGLTRMFDLLRDLDLINKTKKTPIKILLMSLVPDNSAIYGLATKLRTANIPTDIYADNVQLRKKLDYANKIGVEYVGIIGEDEQANNTITIKNMGNAEQTTIPVDKVVEYLRNLTT